MGIPKKNGFDESRLPFGVPAEAALVLWSDVDHIVTNHADQLLHRYVVAIEVDPPLLFVNCVNRSGIF